jgi:CPA1 family monovalent cation:H+ antiporter
VLFLFLPTLIFESAYNLDVRKLLQNLAPILALAIPGLLVSTVLIGAIMTFGWGMAWLVALLLGAMISATDPVAVIAIFKDVGAPKRLLTLVEGESLFNDATAIVVFGLILSLMHGAAASVPMVLVRFLYVFVGGSVVGVLLGMLFAKVIEKVENDQVVEITLTTVLAYLSFIVAEHWLHVSGVMSTVGAGLCMGSYGRTKISPQVREFMHSFWHYMAFVANAIIFLLVGLYLPHTVAGIGMGKLVLPLMLAIGAALLARALVVFGGMPILGKLRMGQIDRPYQAVIFWGGLRGAIALALALSLLDVDFLAEGQADFLLALTAGVVLFTLLVNATTIRKVVQATGLDRETEAERFVKVGSMLDVQHEVARDLEGLRAEAILLPRVLDGLIKANREREKELRGTLVSEADLSSEEILTVHRLQCVAVEKNHYLRLQSEGNLSEPATRDLMHEADVRADQIRRGRPILVPFREAKDKSRFLAPLLRSVPFLRPLAQRLQIRRVAHLYEMARGRFLADAEVLAELDRQRGAGAIDNESLQALEKRYLQRRAEAEEAMDEVTEQFPEFVVNVQEIVGARIALNTEREGYDRLFEQGLMNDEIHGRLAVDLDQRLRTLRSRPVKALSLDPRALLANVPLFASLSEEELDSFAACLAPRSCLKGEVLFREGQQGDRMFLIGRGVVKVWRGEEDKRQLIGTLTAGSFVGEMALLHPAPRVATAQTATVASLMELKKVDLDKVLERFPQVRETLEKAYQERLADLSG